jgi:hypothetical protein
MCETTIAFSGHVGQALRGRLCPKLLEDGHHPKKKLSVMTSVRAGPTTALPDMMNFGQSPKQRCPTRAHFGQSPKQRCPKLMHFGQSPKQRCPK